jgi:hypothetical protein
VKLPKDVQAKLRFTKLVKHRRGLLGPCRPFSEQNVRFTTMVMRHQICDEMSASDACNYSALDAPHNASEKARKALERNERRSASTSGKAVYDDCRAIEVRSRVLSAA